MLRLLLALALAAPATGQEPKATATPVCASATVSSPTDDNGCNYGACKSLTTGSHTCAYDKSFCSTTEEWMTAADVIAAGSECTCKDILDYPMNIGTCSSSGVYSPMAVAGDCHNGGNVCAADSDGHYLLGDTAAGAPRFTACDLKCDNAKGHTKDVPTDTYQDCEFHQVQWATIAQAATGRMYPRRMTMLGDTAVVAGHIKSTGTGMSERPCEKFTTFDRSTPPRPWSASRMRGFPIPVDSIFDSLRHTVDTCAGTDDAYWTTKSGSQTQDFEMHGPFSRSDPDGSAGTSVHEDLKSYNIGGWDQYEMGFVLINGKTGVPLDIVHFGGRGQDGLWDAKGSPDGTKLVASGFFSGNLTVGSTTIYSAESTRTKTMHDGVAMDGWVAKFAADVTPDWVKAWPVSDAGAATSSNCLGVDFDTSKNVFAVGYQCNQTCNGAMAHLASADGSTVTEKEFTDAQHFERVTLATDGSGDFFVRGKLRTTDGTVTAANPTPFGVACVAEDCGVIARMTSTLEVVWARTIEGADFSTRYFSGEVEVDAMGNDYIYVAMRDAAPNGVVPLDSGTPYAGCKDADGVVTPAYLISTTKMVTSTDCPSGSTFVGTDSADAVTAASANTGVHCIGSLEDGCVMKYHAYTGLPIWATMVAGIDAIVSTVDGTLHAIGDNSQADFDTKSTPHASRSWVWHAELDAATGKGKSVQAFGDSSGSSSAYDAAVNSDGDVLVTGYSQANSWYFDDGFTVEYPIENRERNAFLFLIDTDAKVMPSCLESTTTCAIKAEKCYINGVCYDSGDTAANVGTDCKVCDPTQSQTAFVDGPTLGVTQCYINGVCKNAEDKFSYAPRYSAPTDSTCQYCDPPKSSTAWSVKDGFTAVSGTNPPDDCLVADDTATTDSTTASGGGTVDEIDGTQAVAAGVLASLVAFLL